MYHFVELLQIKNRPLFIFGCFNLLAAFAFLLLTRFSKTVVKGANAWYKPFKFALSIGIFSWTMGWYTYELHLPEVVAPYNWAIIVLLGFEVIYIAFQAGRGQLSHYNSSSPVYLFLFQLMGLAAVLVTVWTGYVGLLFFIVELPALPDSYVWAIRMGIILFVVFSFEGALMGIKGKHTIGDSDGSAGLPVLNWSKKYGDLRIAHFIGMHALQVLPLLSWYLLKNVVVTAMAGFLYGLLSVFTLIQALKGRPLPVISISQAAN